MAASAYRPGVGAVRAATPVPVVGSVWRNRSAGRPPASPPSRDFGEEAGRLRYVGLQARFRSRQSAVAATWLNVNTCSSRMSRAAACALSGTSRSLGS